MLFPALDFGSFTSIWYWLALAVFWTLVLSYPMGISTSRIDRAGRSQDAADALDHLAYLIASPWLGMSERSKLTAIVFASAISGLLLTLGFGFGSEFALGMIFFILPGVCVGYLNWACAKSMEDGTPPLTALKRLRIQLLIIAIPSLFATSVAGGFSLIRFGLT